MKSWLENIARLLALAAALLAGCSTKASKDNNGSSSDGKPVVITVIMDAAGAAATDGGGAATTATANDGAKSFTGTYALKPATLFIGDTKDYNNVKQAKDDPSLHMGEGTLTIAVDPSGRVSGTVDTGPASPAIIDGTLMDSEIRGTVRRKTPSDDGLTGTLVAKIAGEGVDGKLALAQNNASILREGQVSLKKK